MSFGLHSSPELLLNCRIETAVLKCFYSSSVIQLIQQWPPAQKSILDKEEDGDDCNGINLDKAKERLQEEDKFDKEEYRKKIKEKHRVSRISSHL